MDNEKVTSELERPIWAVVFSKAVHTSGITYAEAAKLCAWIYKGRGEISLCVVTAAAAARMKA